MGLDLEYMRSELRSNTGTDEDDMPDDKADLYLNRAYWEYLDKYHFREKEITITFDTIAGERLYNTPSPFEALRHLSILNPTSLIHTPINKETIENYEANYDENETAQGIPERYVREGCAVRLRPTPDDVYTLTMKYWTTLADLSTENNPVIPQSWHELIIFGGTWRVFVSLNDWVRAGAAKELVKTLIADQVPVEAKEEYDTHNAGLNVQVRPYDA